MDDYDDYDVLFDLMSYLSSEVISEQNIWRATVRS